MKSFCSKRPNCCPFWCRTEILNRSLTIWHPKIWQKRLIYSVCYFNLGRLEVLFGGLSPPKPPRVLVASWSAQSVCFSALIRFWCDSVLSLSNRLFIAAAFSNIFPMICLLLCGTDCNKCPQRSYFVASKMCNSTMSVSVWLFFCCRQCFGAWITFMLSVKKNPQELSSYVASFHFCRFK